MKLKDIAPPKEHIIPLQRHKLPYDIATANLFEQEYDEEFKLNEELYEALEKSYSREDIRALLQKIFHVYIYPDQYDPDNILILLQVEQRIQIQKLLQLVQKYGWFVSNIEIDDKQFNSHDQDALNTLVILQYKQAILTIQSTQSKETPTPRLLYHATVLQLWETKIKLYGLSPKSKSILSTHPERVYFTTTVNSAVELSREIAQRKLIVARQQKFDPTKFNPEEYYKHWVVLQIDTSKIPRTRKRSYFRVHEDPNVEKKGPHAALFSQNYVPPQAITVVKQFDAY